MRRAARLADDDGAVAEIDARLLAELQRRGEEVPAQYSKASLTVSGGESV